MIIYYWGAIMDEKREKRLKGPAVSLLPKKLFFGSCVILMVGIMAYILLCVFIFFI